MRLPSQDTRHLVGLALLVASVPLLLWQAVPGNQITLAPSTFLAAHSMTEIFAIVVAGLVFFTGYGTAETGRSVRSIVLAYAFLGVAVFDVLHMLSYLGMPDLITPNTPHKAILFWLGARVAAGIGLLAYVLIPETPQMSGRARRLGLTAVAATVAGIGGLFVMSPASVPPTFVQGQGLTPFKIALEWMTFGLYLAVALLLYRRRDRVKNCNVGRLGIALLLMAVGELFFIVYVEVSSTANLLGHAYKVVAYYFLYLAIYAEVVSQPFRRMRAMLTHDELTGLPNRTALSEQLAASVARAQHGGAANALLLLDLDHFQNVNDTLGHEQGDLLLVAVSQRIRALLPHTAYLARFSGDEFVALLSRVTVDQAKDVAEMLLRHMAREFDVGNDRVEISASVGVVGYPTNGESASELMRYADLALHRAKSAGRNCVAIFSPDLAEAIHRRVLLEARLKHALERGELALHYQPKREIASGRLTGWEALLRWRSPGLGDVSPDEFIPVAEQSGLILPIGAWVLREASRQMRAWQSAGLATGTMAVNLSTRQFRQKDLAREVRAVLAETGLAPADLELELTESAIMDNLASAAGVLGELEALGIRIAVDDFGTGYSSLSYLKTFSIHCLKIDSSFIRDIPGDENDTAIVRTIIALADSLGLAVVAEGVETEAQLAYLRANHCDQMQGYLYSRPLPPDECVSLMRRRTAQAA